MYCEKCGNKLEDNINICKHCEAEAEGYVECVNEEVNDRKEDTTIFNKIFNINPIYITIALSIISLLSIFQKWVKVSAYKFQGVRYNIVAFLQVAFSSNRYLSSVNYIFIIMGEVLLIISLVLSAIFIIIYLFKTLKKDAKAYIWGELGAMIILFMSVFTIILCSLVNIMEGIIYYDTIYINDYLPTIFVFIAAFSSAISLKCFFRKHN